MRTASLITLLLLCMGLGACASPGYYYQAAAGHMSLMRSRQDIDDYLASAPKDDELAARLQVAQQMLTWADAELGLPANGSYGSFAETDGGPVTWIVVATPEFSLEPKQFCFLVVGCVSYKGYYKEEKARRNADKLAEQGWDVNVARGAAYSTLGWFEDPILDTMLEQPDPQLAGTLFHELAHQRLYIKGDSRFNESYASFIEQKGVERWMQLQSTDEERQHLALVERAQVDFRDLMFATRDELAELYVSGQDESSMRAAKEATLQRLASDYRAMVKDHWNGADFYGGMFNRQLNNADFALLGTYRSGNCAFERLFQEVDGDFTAFHQQAEALADADDATRRGWLDQPC